MNHSTSLLARCCLAALALSTTAVAVQAADTTTALAYPARGQSDKQQARDRQECAGWAKQQSGYDPAAAAAGAQQPPPQPYAAPPSQGAGMQGMLSGAAGGAAIAELSHSDVGRGAAIGVLGAGARERIKQQKAAAAQQQQQQARQQQMAQQSAQQKGLSDRAFAACMEGRGYVLK